MFGFIRNRLLAVLILALSGFCRPLSGQDQVVIFPVNKGWVGDTNFIELRATGFKNILAFQLSFRDENRLGQLAGIDQVRLPNFNSGNYSFHQGFNALTVSWDFAAQGMTLPDGETLFRIKWLSDPLQSHCYEIANAPVIIEFLNTNANSIPVNGYKSCQSVQFIPTYLSVYRDANSNCSYDNQEQLLSDYTIIDSFNGRTRILKNPQLLSFSSAEFGFHYFSISSKSSLWNACNRSQRLYIDSTTKLISLQFGLQPVSVCPLLEVEVSSPIVRRCVNYNYQIHYKNTGTIAEPNSLIRITLDSFMIYKGASIQPSLIQWPVVEFAIGNLDVFEEGVFLITVELDCNRTLVGQTHCLKAEILPKVNCLSSPNWSGAHVEVNGICSEGKVKFRILNSGEQNMTEPSQYWIVEDDIMPGLKKNVLLNKGAFLDLEYPANGKTYRLMVDQVAFHPGQSNPTVAIEGCGKNQQGDFSRGYVLQFPEDEEDLHIAIDCQESRGSFDPNDKTAWPRGYGQENFIEPNRQIEYRIRFQNTGNDTAFQVAIFDTLDSWLDLETFKMTGSSHPYRYSLVGNVLTVRFDGIQLPHRSANETGSQGYITYALQPLSSAPLKARINNTAEIVFDMNAAIITNTTLHTLSKDFIVVSTQPPAGPEKHMMNIYPNPNNGLFQIEFKGLKQQGIVSILDACGNMCFRLPWEGQPLSLDLNGMLEAGIYFVKFENNRGIIAFEKLMIVPSKY